MENLKPIHTEWQHAKKRAAALCIRAGRDDVAQRINACTVFRGDETLEELCTLLHQTQSIEFMTSFGFPTLSVFRKFTRENAQRYGVYIDAGDITLTDVPCVLLVGKTRARLTYNATQRNTVCALHGASAHVEAFGYSVLSVEVDTQSSVKTILHEHAYAR